MKIEVLTFNEQTHTGLTAYLLDSSKEFANVTKRPAVLIFPGGGYTMCSDREAEPVAMSYLAQGYHAFVLRYSVGEKNQWPAPFEDAQRAIKILHDNSKQWEIDTNKIAVVGFSAGGHLAAALSTMGSIRPNAMILGYPCILEEMSKILNNPIPGLDDKINDQTPPAFLFATRDDNVVPVRHTIRFMEELDKANIPFEAHIYYSGVHGLSLAKSHTSSGIAENVNQLVAGWFEQSIEWLKQVFGDFAHDISVSEYVLENGLDHYSIDDSLAILLKSEACKPIISQYIPQFLNEEVINQTKGVSLRVICGYSKDIITNDLLQEMDNKLLQIRKEKNEE